MMVTPVLALLVALLGPAASELEIIGAGFGRTGTDSLRKALTLLHYKTYHMKEILMKMRFKDVNLWIQYFDGEIQLPELANEIYHKSSFNAAVDFPTCTVWEELAALYPNAKIILTERASSEVWWESGSKTILIPRFPLTLFLSVSKLIWLDVNAMLTKMFKSLLGFSEERYPTIEDKSTCIAAYEKNSATARRFDKKRILIFDVRQGWGPLCAFLGVEIPDVPFPRSNHQFSFYMTMYVYGAVFVLPLLILGFIMRRQKTWVAKE